MRICIHTHTHTHTSYHVYTGTHTHIHTHILFALEARVGFLQVLCVCCSVLQSVSQCVAVCCEKVLQRVAVCCCSPSLTEYTCIYRYFNTCIQIYIYIQYIYMDTTDICTHIYTYTHTYTHTHINIRSTMYIQVQTHTHTHTSYLQYCARGRDRTLAPSQVGRGGTCVGRGGGGRSPLCPCP